MEEIVLRFTRVWTAGTAALSLAFLADDVETYVDPHMGLQVAALREGTVTTRVLTLVWALSSVAPIVDF